MKRTLSLKRETLSELTSDDLVTIVGGANAITVQGLTCPLLRCNINISDLLGCLPTADGGCNTGNC